MCVLRTCICTRARAHSVTHSIFVPPLVVRVVVVNNSNNGGVHFHFRLTQAQVLSLNSALKR